MKRTGCTVAAALLLGLLLAGITGCLIWHSAQGKCVRAEMVGVPGGTGVASVEVPEPEEGDGAETGVAADSDGAQETDGLQGVDDARGTDDPDAADSGLSVHSDGTEAQEPGTGASNEDSSLRLVFAGDILLSGHVLSAYRKADNVGGVMDSRFRRVIDDSDIFMANEELPLSRRGTAAADKRFTLRLSSEHVSTFQGLGISIIALANDHALDFGTDALLDTCDTLDDAGILRVGVRTNLEEAKKPVFMEAKGHRIGFLSASRVIPKGSRNATSKGPGMLTTYDPPLLLEEIKKTREVCSYLVVCVHWGIERDGRPREYQRTLGQQYIDAGADFVIGSHPHILQGLKYYKGGPIAYSLGNFVFGSSTPETALLTVEWGEEDTLLRLVSGTSSGGYTRILEDEGEEAGFYQCIASISYGTTVGEDGITAPVEEKAAE